MASITGKIAVSVMVVMAISGCHGIQMAQLVFWQLNSTDMSMQLQVKSPQVPQAVAHVPQSVAHVPQSVTQVSVTTGHVICVSLWLKHRDSSVLITPPLIIFIPTWLKLATVSLFSASFLITFFVFMVLALMEI
jgi:hypothetical protein